MSQKWDVLLLILLPPAVVGGCFTDAGPNDETGADTVDVDGRDRDAGTTTNTDADGGTDGDVDGDVDGGVSHPVDEVDGGTTHPVDDVDGGTTNPAGNVDAGTEEGSGDVDAGSAGDTPLPPCPVFADGTTGGFLLNLSVREASGVVEGRVNPGILWTHEDSGGEPRLFAMTTAGRPRGTFVLAGASANDWEDIAAGPGRQGEPALYVGDIGDNGTARDGVQVYRVAEPVVGSNALATTTLDDVERFDLVYPDGPHNAETLLVDPRGGDLYIVVKSGDGQSPVFVARAPLNATTTTTLQRVTTLQFGTEPLAGDRTTTAGDITAAGDAIAIRTYDRAFLWRRRPGDTIAAALGTTPCPLPLRDEGQGEALGFAGDGNGYYSLSEGSAVRLFFYARQPPQP